MDAVHHTIVQDLFYTPEWYSWSYKLQVGDELQVLQVDLNIVEALMWK